MSDEEKKEDINMNMDIDADMDGKMQYMSQMPYMPHMPYMAHMPYMIQTPMMCCPYLMNMQCPMLYSRGMMGMNHTMNQYMANPYMYTPNTCNPSAGMQY